MQKIDGLSNREQEAASLLFISDARLRKRRKSKERGIVNNDKIDENEMKMVEDVLTEPKW